MDINSIYNNILNKYNLLSVSNGYEIYIEYLIKSIVKKWNDINDECNIAIWGAGEHTEKLFEIVDISRKKIKCLIDKNPSMKGKKISNIEVISVDMLKDYNIDMVVVSSPRYQNEIIKELKELDYDYVDLYESIGEFNTNFEPWYKWERMNNKYSHYYDENIFVYLLKCIYEKEENDKSKDLLLQAIIKKYLQMYNIVQAKYFIKIYNECGYKEKQYDDFLEEIEKFFSEIREHLKHKKHNNIIMIICDALRYKDIDEIQDNKNRFRYLSEFSKESIFYTNAVANSTYTRAALYSMLTGKMITHEKTYMNDKYVVNYNESDFILEALKKNYYIVNDTITRFIPDNINIKNIRVEEIYEGCTTQLWRMLSYLCNANDKMIYLMHFNETHSSYVCGFHNNTNMKNLTQHEIYKKNINLEEQYLECLENIDKKLGFYLNILPKEAYKIITSDHGQCFGEHGAYTHTFTWYDEILHTPLMINCSKIKPEIRSELFDKRDTGKLVSAIVNNIDLNEMYFEKIKYVRCERDALHSPYYLNDKEFINAIGTKFTKGFTVIRSLDKKYIRYDDGIEEIYDLSNEDKNIINELDTIGEFRRRI